MDGRIRYVARVLAQQYAMSLPAVEEVLLDEKHMQQLTSFMQPNGPPTLIFFRQARETYNDDGELIETSAGTGEQELFLTTGETDCQKGRAVYFMRTNEAAAVTQAQVEQELSYGVVGPSALDTLQANMNGVFQPLVTQPPSAWRSALSQEASSEFMASFGRFHATLSEAVSSLQGGFTLRRPERTFDIENKAVAFNRAGGDPEIVASFEAVVEDWCDGTGRLLNESDANRQEGDETGPETELEYWRVRMAKFNAITEQLRGRDCKVVLGVLSGAKSRVLKRWKLLDNQITDANNEAKDNVKYLSTLEKYIEPLTSGTPHGVLDALPGLLNNIKMMHTIARYYNTAERMTTLFRKITNAMIANCRQYVHGGGGGGGGSPASLWDQPLAGVIARLRACLELNEGYQEQYSATRERLLSQPKGKQFDFNEVAIFGKFDLFCRRVEKLVDMFSTVEQFTVLASHNVEGMEPLMQRFRQIIDAFARKPYALLDYQKGQFDRDYLEFNANIHELESSLQGFINASFENITSTEQALHLLKQFQAILQRDALKDDLDSKLMVIFHNYGLDLETVQRLYEKQKHTPPTVRNSPPVTGSVLWARQLMRRIEEPMLKFQENQNLMTTKESKKIVKTYNRIARTIVEFETLWHIAWTKSIEASKAGLQATLIIRHPSNGKLYVNFDREIMQLIREAKCLMRMGAEVPESARMVLLQEDKFKSYFNQLSYALEQHDAVLEKVLPVVEPLLRPHIEDMQRKIHPGMLTLTWTSMNIDGYLHRIHAGLARLDDLVIKIRDLIENRIERNLKEVSKAALVDLPKDESFVLDKFVTLQERHVKDRAIVLSGRNQEIEEAVADLLELISSYALEPGIAPAGEAEQARLREHYGRLMYRAVLNSTKQSLGAIKRRVGSRASGGFLFLDQPFFDVDVELTIPSVSMTPSLDDIQMAINRCARAILGCSRHLLVWSTPEHRSRGTTVFDDLAADREIVKMVLLLTGSIEGAKRQVFEYLRTFERYDWLWKGNQASAYAEFMSRKPTLEAFEAELQKYEKIEHDIQKIAPVHNIGALSLETAPLKCSLKAEAAAWKAQYSQNLHGQAKKELDRIIEWMDEMTRMLKREVSDLDTVRSAMAILREIRDKDGSIELELSPVEQMYAILSRYEVRVSKEEVDMVNDLPYSWRKLKRQADEVSDQLAALQSSFKTELVRNVKQFHVDASSFRSEWESQGPTVPGITPMQGHERLLRFKRQHEDKMRRWDEYAAGEELFGLPKTHYPELAKTKKEIELLERVYSLYMDVITTVGEYKELMWTDVPGEMGGMLQQMEAFQAACKRMPKALREYQAFAELKRTIDDFLETLPLVQALAHPCMRSRHWQQLMQMTSRHLPVSSDAFRLHNLLEAQLLEWSEDVEDITNSALKELQLEEKLGAISEEWADAQLGFASFKSRGPIALKGGETGELMEKLEETMMNLGAMTASRYIGPFKDEVVTWLTKLSTVSEVLEQWVQVQAMWQYLEAVFTSGDIAKQLPQEAKRFQTIDKNWEKIMTKALETRNVVAYCYGNDVLKNLLPHLLEQLELCQKALSGYLDQKRAAFPRFFFVSDAVLLEILSQGSNPEAIQAHLGSVFDSIAAVRFDAVEKAKVLSFESAVGERVELSAPITAEGNIEDWLNALLQGMRGSINRVVQAAALDCDSLAIEPFTHKYPAQVALLGIQFMWTLDCEDSLYRSRTEKGAMGATNRKNLQRLNDMIAINLKTDGELLEHGRSTRKKVETMILVDVHQRDVFDDICKKKIKDPEDFEWAKQARCYWRHDLELAKVCIADMDFSYCNEYLGVKERLVITPLTDRCYITLSQALGMSLGGAPAGPAGTGKTETTKDLGCTLGKYVIVTNCSDQMDYRSTGRIFKGLAQSGCWGCFDEFNRIDLEVLSVVAQQVGSVLCSIREDRRTFTFTDGQVINLNKEVGFFITMNPGYAGRQELPENLKSLFRGVTMMVPERQIIMKVKLTAAGYKENSLLAKKFNVFYRLCEHQLSKQPHYDFGLRNILAVLRTAGQSKRDQLDAPEAMLLMRTLRDMNLSKYVAEDAPLFLSLIDDLFPGLTAEKQVHKEVEASLARVLPEMSLQHVPSWVAKVVQVYEMSLVRHSLMAVGPSGVGKSRIVEALQRALEGCKASPLLPPMVGQPHREVRMNPKAITSPQMFGCLDVVANEWTEGIFSSLWRKANKDKNRFTWLVLDGPVDAIWIENMNTVMDDNQILTLANNDRIPMLRPNVTLHFEVEDLRNASPATVSRAGIIYISLSDLGWLPMVESWLCQRKSSEAAHLRRVLRANTQPIIDFVARECKPSVACSPVSLLTSTVSLLQALLGEYAKERTDLEPEVQERLVIFALVWSLGGLLETADRQRLDKWLRQHGEFQVSLPEAAHPDTIYEYRVDEASGEWAHWGSQIPSWELPPGGRVAEQFATLFVPTIDAVRLERTAELAVGMGRPILLVGGSGTAKTSTMLRFLGRQDPAHNIFKKVSFSSATTPIIFQRQVEASVEKRQGRTFGPPGGKRMLVFVDDMSMPAYNEWGDQITLEIMRQLMEYGGIYSLEKPGEWKTVLDLLFLGAMLSPGGGKNDIPNRAKRHFHLLTVTLPSQASIHQIFGSMVRAQYEPRSEQRVDSVWAAADKLVDLTIGLWAAVKAKMLPTPAKFHYIFNLRDLSRVFQGIFMCPAAGVLSTDAALYGLWKHECERVFADRLVDHADKAWFATTVHRHLEEKLGAAKAKPLQATTYFVDFMRDADPDPETGEEGTSCSRVYEPVTSLAAVRPRVQGFMERFNEAHRLRAVDLVLFDDALLHFMRISRILRTPRGSALLVGVGGSGKQSLTRLAAYAAGASFAQITVTNSYSTTNLLEDFKPLYREAGVKAKGCAFIFTDKEVKEEGFLEYINIFLNTGELPSLFARDELDALLGELAAEYTKEGLGKPGEEPTAEELATHLIRRVRDHLHLVLCFSPVGDKFRSRAQKFPALINGCTVDVFLPWPEVALTDVARHFLGSFELRGDPKEAEAVRGALVSHMGKVHSMVSASTQEFFERYRRNVYVTPKSYLSFIQTYRQVYASKVSRVEELASSIKNGLVKIEQARGDVGLMKIELKEKGQTLVVAQEKSALLLQEITTSTSRAEKKKGEVQQVADMLKGEKQVIAEDKRLVEEDLLAAKPALDGAREALNAITPKDIMMLKALKKPPELIKRLFDCVLILMHEPLEPDVTEVRVASKNAGGEVKKLEVSWRFSVPMMARGTFLDELQNYPKDEINDETIELLYPYMSDEDMTYENAKKASGNVAGLSIWARAMVSYTAISKVVKPKMEAVKVAEGKLRVAGAKLDKAQGELDACQVDLDRMQSDFDAAMGTKQAIQADADATAKRMDAANKLIGGLGGEYARWQADSEAFADEIGRLAGDVALACAFISYAGPFNAEFRQLLLRDRFEADCTARHIPVTAELSITSFMVDEATLGDWAQQGLPGDPLSAQNGIMVTRSTKYPLLIDPQGQGLMWIKRREESQGLRVTQLNERRFRNQLEDAMAFGQPLLLENVEEVLDPLLDPVLDKAVQRSGRGLKIVLADKECEFTESFRMFLTTKLSNPHFTPELYAQVSVINFTVTMQGLEQQLLGRVVQRERAELEEQRQKLMAEVNANRKALNTLEDDLLYRLANSTGNLLDDAALIEVLQVTKTTSAEVKEKLANATETDKRINVAREEYRPVATRGSLLYFLITDMAAVNNMYQVSLQQFLELFDYAIHHSDRSPLASKRMAHIIELLSFHVTTYMQRGLFERHKATWTLMLALRMQAVAGLLPDAYVQVLLKGGGALDLRTERPKPFGWLPDGAWLNVLQLSRSLSRFRDLPDALLRSDPLWRRWYDEDAPEAAKVPEYEEQLNAFERLLLVRALRVDRTLLCVQRYVVEVLGPQYTDSRPLDWRLLEEEADCHTPIIALLSQGGDPTAAIHELAKRKKQLVRTISMGQGQEPAARKLIATGVTQGSWVMLQNCHLGLRFMAELETTLLKMDEVSPDFKLWLTTEPHPRFPIGLLQMSIKITNEAPAGIRAGLKGSYAWISQDMLDASNHLAWKPMLYALCFMHTVVQERRKFGPLGFNIPYEFNQSDLSACTQFLQNHLGDIEAKKRPVDWLTVNYMVCEVQYGGRITDDWDRRLFNTYGQAWLAPRILEIPFQFFHGYRVPSGADVDSYRKYVEGLPLIDDPEIFGLHGNADLVFRTAQTQQVLGTILDIQPKEGGGGGGQTREEVVLLQVEDLQEKLPADYREDATRAAVKALGGMGKPLHICLQQEVDRLQRVISTVRASLANLKLAIAGTIVMSPELANALDALFLARVPQAWVKASQLEASTLGVWFTNILQRAEQLSAWLKHGRPHCFWLTGFFNPQGFLTANRQEVCRKHARDGWALDDVVNFTKVVGIEREEVRKPPEEGLYVHGLFLDGCRWDKAGNKLADSTLKVLYAALPVLLVTGMLASEKKSDMYSYTCPCYKNPKRGGLNFVFAVDLRSEDPPQKWILRGVSLLAATG